MKSNFVSNRDYSGIHLFNESSQSLPVDQEEATRITKAVEKHESCSFHLIEIAFVDEDQIISVNKKYLNHHYVTDVITFRMDEATDREEIEGTLYCCAPRLLQQAEENSVSPKNEFSRIIVHGLLHLYGYDDQTEIEKEKMTERENFYLDIITQA